MLGKLIKHEFAATWRVMLILSLVLAGIGIVLICTFGGVSVMLENTPDYNEGALSLTLFSLLTLLFVATIAVFILTKVFLAIRYYRNLYTAEGYLTFTLPASATQIITAKVIVGIIWTLLITFLLLYTCFCAIFGFTLGVAEPVDFPSMSTDLVEILTFDNAILFPLLVTVYVLSTVTALLSYYFCITVGQLWAKHKILGAILCFIGLSVATKIITWIWQIVSGFSGGLLIDGLFMSSNEFSAMYVRTLVGRLILLLLLGVLYYLGCVLITKKKVNLD